MALASAIAFLAADSTTRGFAPWETVLAAPWLTPLVARSVAQAAFIPLAVPVILLAFTHGIAAPRQGRNRRILGSAPG